MRLCKLRSEAVRRKFDRITVVEIETKKIIFFDALNYNNDKTIPEKKEI